MQLKFASAMTTTPVELKKKRKKNEYIEMIISARRCDQKWESL